MIQMVRDGDYLGFLVMILSTCFVVFCCLPIHEFAHAYVAYKCGDDTARLKGRLTINPFAHLDFIGTLMIFFFGIGYAKPVPVNPARLKHPRRDMALISLAGPVSNLLMAFVSVWVYYILMAVGGSNIAVGAVAYFFSYAAQINVMLAVFNLLPIPPLDGSKIFSAILPDRIYFKIMQYEQYIFIGLMLFMVSGALDVPLSFLRKWAFTGIDFITGFVDIIFKAVGVY